MSIQVRYEIYGSWKTPKTITAEEVLQSLKAQLSKMEEEQGHKFVGNFNETEVITSVFRFRIPVIVAYDGNELSHLRFLLKLCVSFLSDLNLLSGTVVAMGNDSFDQLGENQGYTLDLSEI